MQSVTRDRDPADVLGGPTSAGRVDVVVLRTYPKDSSLARLLTVLTSQLTVRAVIWDRTGDYECPVRTPRLEVESSTLRGDYYRVSTVLRVAFLQPWFLWRVLRARPRAVHSMDLDTAVPGLVAARLLTVPFVYQCLDPYAAALPEGWPRPLARLVQRLEDFVVSAADLFVITDLKRMPQHAGANPRAVVELPNIPMRDLAPAPRRDGAELVVGYVGSLVPHRSLDVVVDTVGRLADSGVRLVLGGFGPLEDELRARAAAFPNVSFIGWVPDDDIMDVMSGFDVFVQIEDPDHAGYRWVSPNKVFESMALGRPVVVASGTLAAERVEESGHGVTVPYGDGAALEDVLERLRSRPELRAALGEAGRAAYSASWSTQSVTRGVVAAYPVTSRHALADPPAAGGPR